MAFDFTQSSTLVAGIGGQTIGFSRATSGWEFNSAGSLTDAGSGNPRFDYNPSTLAANGVLIESASTNGIRNAVMAGAVVGSPGTDPDYWQTSAVAGNLTAKNIIAVGTEDGINYTDIQYTASGAVAALVVYESSTQIVAADGQTWTGSQFVKLVGGSLTNVSLVHRTQYRTVTGVNVATNDVAFVPTSAALRTQKLSNTFTASGGTIERVTNGIIFTFSGAGDITLRIGTPQLEQKSVATSPILSAGAATTRNIDRLSITDLTAMGFNSAQGTLVARVAVGLPAAGANQFVARFSDNTYNNQIAMNITTGGYPQLSTASGGVFDGGVTDGDIMVANTFATFAVSWQSGRLEISKNGGAITADTSFTFPTGMTRLDIGGDHAGANAFITGWQKWLRYYPRAITGGALQQLASQA